MATGFSLGKAVTGLRVVNRYDGGLPGFRGAAGRTLPWVVPIPFIPIIEAGLVLGQQGPPADRRQDRCDAGRGPGLGRPALLRTRAGRDPSRRPDPGRRPDLSLVVPVQPARCRSGVVHDPPGPEPPLQVVFGRSRGNRASTSPQTPGSVTSSASVNPPPRIARSTARAGSLTGRPLRQSTHRTPPSPTSSATSGFLGPALHATVQLRRQPLVGQQLQVERRHYQRRGALVQYPQRTQQHPVATLVGLPVEAHHVDHLEQRRGIGEAVRIQAQALEAVDGLGLGDYVELSPSGEELGCDVARRLQPSAEPAPGPAHPLGDRPDLAMPGREQHDDPVRLAQPPGTKHDPVIAVEAHPRIPPSRRHPGLADARRSGGCGPGTP